MDASSVVSSRPLVDVRLEDLCTGTGQAPHLAHVSVHVRYGEFFTFLGPAQSGKTAVLRAIAGFLPLSAGRVRVDENDVGDLPPGRRGMGYVFHLGALWPHLTVYEHVEFGLRLQALSPANADRRVQLVTRRLGLADVVDRRPDELSLHQKRRLALARALAVEPRVLLLDEPLAHLDPMPRKALRLELARLHRDLRAHQHEHRADEKERHRVRQPVAGPLDPVQEAVPAARTRRRQLRHRVVLRRKVDVRIGATARPPAPWARR